MNRLRASLVAITVGSSLVLALPTSGASTLPKTITAYAKCMAPPLREYSKTVDSLRALVDTYIGNHKVTPLQTVGYNLGGYAVTFAKCQPLAPTLWINYYTQELVPLVRSLAATVYEITTPSVGSTVKEINLAVAKEKNVNADLALLDKKIVAWDKAHP